ncbi:collagen alpha-1(I) chain-like [Bubalus bubalis]|uniref:collagen alpha-1(I) chain-like n=1 Tax=Bubalus bubalis TaxID=89462 RepID=UPI001D0FCF90|nr:collagen alpha-1(I) chain-like [Bubalus bubalis]
MAPKDPPGSSPQSSGLGSFCSQHAHSFLNLFFIFRRGWRGVEGESGLASPASTRGRGWRCGQWAASGHRGQQPISIAPPGRRDLARARGMRNRGGTDRERPPGTGPLSPSTPRPLLWQVTAPPPPLSPPAAAPLFPGAHEGPGARVESARTRKGAGLRAGRGARPPPVVAWRLAPLWQPFSAAAAAGALQSEAEAAAARQRRRGQRGAGSSAGGAHSVAGAGAGGSQCRHRLPPLPLLHCRQSGAAPRGERLRSHPFPAILYPGWRLPKEEPRQTKPAPGPRGPLQPTRAGRPGGSGARALAPPLPGSPHSPSQGGGFSCDGHSPSPRGSARTSSTSVAGLDPRLRRSPPWLREGGWGPPQAGRVTRAGCSSSLEFLLFSTWVGWGGGVTNPRAPTDLV